MGSVPVALAAEGSDPARELVPPRGLRGGTGSGIGEGEEKTRDRGEREEEEDERQGEGKRRKRGKEEHEGEMKRSGRKSGKIKRVRR